MGRYNKRTGYQAILPNVTERLKMKLRLSPNLMAMLTVHGQTKVYLHHFKIIQSPECSCKHGDQTTDHLLYDCEILGKEREKLIAYTSREEDWPVWKRELVNKYVKQFTNFANSIDFEKLNKYLKTNAQSRKGHNK